MRLIDMTRERYKHIFEATPPPTTISFRQALKILRSPYLGGVVISFFIVTHFWQAGFDALNFYLRWPPLNATTPYWVYLVTYPLSWLGWPLSWQVLAAGTVIVASLIYAMRGNGKWWIIVFSAPMLFNAWWGQVEVFSLLGMILGLLVLQKKIHPAWIGVVWLFLGIKIQTNYGLILLLTFWFWRQEGFKAMLPGTMTSLSIIALTLVIWPGWPMRLLGIYSETKLGFANASLWPYGILAWPFALLPVSMSSNQRLRMVTAASLLGSPYFTLHHCLTLMVLTDYTWQLPLSWLPMIMIFQTRDWSMYAWVIPLVILCFESGKIFWGIYLRKKSLSPKT